MKNIIIIILVVVLLGLGGYFLLGGSNEGSYKDTEKQNGPKTEDQNKQEVVENQDQEQNMSGEEQQVVIGKSVEDREIIAYHYGSGDKELLFIGGIHGGYSWNTALVAYEMIDYLNENLEMIPENIKVTVIPVLNPDGLQLIAGAYEDLSSDELSNISLDETIPGRFNANNVDLNRNFDCEWESTGTWQNREVDAGNEPFSEPESLAIKNYIESTKPSAVVVWYSSAGGVFTSSCRNGVLPETKDITDVYANASGYKAYKEFDFYEITGDMVNWLAKENIPAISVLLTNHNSTEWNKNKAGIEALFEYYSE